MSEFQRVNATIINRAGVEVGFHYCDGGLVNLNEGYKNDQGFYVVLAPDSTEGLLNVKPYQSDTFKTFPFFKGSNPMLIKEIATTGHTATNVYWVK